MIILSARWVVRRFVLSPVPTIRLGMGLLALVLMLAAEFGFVLWLRGMTITEYLAIRDPVSGAVYYASLVVFTVMPLYISRDIGTPPADRSS